MELFSEWIVVTALILLMIAFVGFNIYLTARWDRRRIRAYIAARGGSVDSIMYRHFGRGWIGQENTRAYLVRYVDADGVAHRATCRTAWLAGVYFTDEVFESVRRHDARRNSAPPPPILEPDSRTVQELKEENARLRAELDRLKRGNRTPSE